MATALFCCTQVKLADEGLPAERAPRITLDQLHAHQPQTEAVALSDLPILMVENGITRHPP